MLESIQFKNFKCLRDTTLKLGRFTLIVGPNGSGKSTALEGIQASHSSFALDMESLSASIRGEEHAAIEISTKWEILATKFSCVRRRTLSGDNFTVNSESASSQGDISGQIKRILRLMQVFSFDPRDLAKSAKLMPETRLDSHGANLASVLDSLRDLVPERFEALNAELGNWLPEFDRILFRTPEAGNRAIHLRKRVGHQSIAARHLSQGTLLAIAVLTLAHLPDPPPIVGIEEPERGIHPRLLRDVKDALYRLAYPDPSVSNRQPVQVIATTHSPYMLDLFRDHPEDIVIAEKLDDEAKFHSLTETEHYQEIISGAPLGELWYSGVLGGVPQNR